MIPFATKLAYAPSRSFGGDSNKWKAPLERFLSPALLPELYQRRTALGGQSILPIFCAETQNDHVQRGKSRAHIGLMLRVQRHTQFCVEQNDDRLGRIFIQAQSKYGMHHNGDHGDNEMRKKVCLATTRKLFECCEANALLAFLDETKQAGFETDDLADAFSLALAKAIEWFKERKKVLGWVHGQGIPIIGFDFGTRNYALCILEVLALDASREETYVTWENETKEHQVERPHFRVLRWQLLDLLDNTISANYRGPSEIYKRLDANVNVTAPAYEPKAMARMIKRAAEEKAPKRKRGNEEGGDADDARPVPKRARNEPKKTTKRKRGDDDDDAPPVPKRARKNAPKKPMVVIDVRDEDE